MQVTWGRQETRTAWPTVIAGLIILAVFSVQLSCASPSSNQALNAKATLQLINQAKLRLSQIETPTTARLEEMITRGMNVDNLGTQRVFIYLNLALTTSQAKELAGLGITLYVDSWTPPVGANPNGFLIADVPVDKLDELAAKTYVVRLDTAENVRKPQSLPQAK